MGGGVARSPPPWIRHCVNALMQKLVAVKYLALLNFYVYHVLLVINANHFICYIIISQIIKWRDALNILPN